MPSAVRVKSKPSIAVLQGRAMPDGERLFREHHERKKTPEPAAALRMLMDS
jgi:hypothetical protein